MRLDLPGPVQGPGLWLTAYRSAGKVGVFLPLRGEAGEAMRAAFAAELSALREESGLDLVLAGEDGSGTKPSLGVTIARASLDGEAGELAWLWDTTNRMVTLLRPRLSVWIAEAR